MDSGLAVGSLLLTLPGLVIWSVILLLPWRPWSTRESLDTDNTVKSADLSRITVIIPARNEEEVISETLDALAVQGADLKIILVDDQSDDQTAVIARRNQLPCLEIIQGQNLPEGWSGKLWALEQGRQKAKTELVLLMDADIKLKPGILATALDQFDNKQLDMLSLMAYLQMESFWEKLFMPAFIFFFKLLYPFSITNSSSPYVAAAAGGFILIKKNSLEKIGAFDSLRHCLIDDCSLARQVKKSGGKIWLGLTHSVISMRTYKDLRGIWDMVARTAYTQLGYSLLFLVLCTLLMIACFVFPLLAAVSGNQWQFTGAIFTLIVMYACYLPTLKYYKIHPFWGVLLPFTGFVFLCMTWSSAWRYWFKSGANWKNRNYPSSAHK